MSAFTLSVPAQIPPAEKVSSLFRYEGYSQAEYESFTRSSRYVSMPDSVKLAVDIFLPAEGPAREVFPVAFIYTPYNRAFFIPRMGLLKHTISALTGNGWGPVYDFSTFGVTPALLAHGYAVVVAEMRGTGASFGSQMPLMPQLGKDGKELVDWIAAQSWCDGNVGMLGPSYLGWSQFATATHRPEALKCIMPEVIGFEMYTGGNRPGGIAAERWLRKYGGQLRAMNLSTYNLKKFLLPALPVVDEDGDGKLVDERPVIDTTQLDTDMPPRYRDKTERSEHIYYQAILDHRDNIPVDSYLEPQYRYFDSEGPHPYDSLGYLKASPASFLPSIMESGIPVYHVGGWFDGFVSGTTRLYASMAATNPSRLMIAPRMHLPLIPKGYRKAFGYEEDYEAQLITEQLRFFDRYLKGIDNGIDGEQPVHLYVMNRGWRAASSWPPAEAETQSLYVQAGGSLAENAPEEGLDAYRVDPSHSSSYGKKERNRWLMQTAGPKKVMDRSDKDKQCLVYETAPLTEGMEVTGHPIVNLWLSSDREDGDVFVYLCDVDEKGNSQYITEGQLRAGWHRLQDDDEQAGGLFDVKPDLPWHGFREAQYDERPFAEGKVLEFRFELMPTSWYFRPGHRIRIAIAGVDAGNFELNPVLCPENEVAAFPETTLFLHRGTAYPSRIELPVVPASAQAPAAGAQ